MLERELNDYFDYKVLKENFNGNLNVYKDIPLFVERKIFKKLDYHAYVADYAHKNEKILSVSEFIEQSKRFIEANENQISKLKLQTNYHLREEN